MAKINLLTGTLSGKIGNMVYSSWRGIPYTRSLPKRNTNRQPSLAQLAQRQKFGLAVRFAGTLTPLLNLAYPAKSTRSTGQNSAISYICKHAITGIAPHLELDYANILISRGSLLNTESATATANADGQVKFRWISTGDAADASNKDKALLVVYCPALEQSAFNIAAADRQAEMALLDAAAFSGHTVHSWLGFLSENGKMAADSIYTGAFFIS